LESSEAPSIELESIEARRDTLFFKISYGEELDPFLTSGLLYVKYDFPVEDIPVSVLSIPLLGFLAPLGWLTGANIKAGEVNREYLASLTDVAN